MERRVKERLVGASILVALVVLIVPELLSGPKPAALPAPSLLPATASAPEAVRNVTVDLATSKPPQASETEAPPVATELPAPVNRPSIGTAPATQAAASPAVTMQASPSVETQSPPPTSAAKTQGDAARRDWAVQLGSFASRVNSDKLVHQLKAQGFPVYELSGGAGRAVRYRVRVGPLPDRPAAEHTMAKLKALGHASSVVAPSR